MRVRLSGLCFLSLFLAVGSVPAQSRKPTPTPKEKIIHPSAVAIPTPVRPEPEVLSLNLEKISLTDSVDLLERLTGEKHVLSISRPPAEVFLSLRLQGAKNLVIHQLRQAISNQAEVLFVRQGAGWTLTERIVPTAAASDASPTPSAPATVAPGLTLGPTSTPGPQRRPHPPTPVQSKAPEPAAGPKVTPTPAVQK